MKKIIAIGDVHGLDNWKNFADINVLLSESNIKCEYDYYIFIGDYCDSFDKKNNEIYDNLLEIIKFKKLYPDNVILLWGNHELQYALDNPFYGNSKYICSGYRPEIKFDLHEIFKNNFDLFQLSFQYNNYIFTHAGIHKGWYEYRFIPMFNDLEKYLNDNNIKNECNNISDKLNLAFNHKLDCIFDVGYHRGGRENVGGPLWLDKQLHNKCLDNYHQVVGHTKIDKIYTFNKNDSTSITFIDCLVNNIYYSVNI